MKDGIMEDDLVAIKKTSEEKWNIVVARIEDEMKILPIIGRSNKTYPSKR